MTDELTPFQRFAALLFNALDATNPEGYRQMAMDVEGTDFEFANLAATQPALALKMYAQGGMSEERLRRIADILCRKAENPRRDGSWLHELISEPKLETLHRLFGEQSQEGYVGFLRTLAKHDANTVFVHMKRLLQFRARMRMESDLWQNLGWDGAIFPDLTPWLTLEQREEIREAVIEGLTLVNDAETLFLCFTQKQQVTLLSRAATICTPATASVAAALLLRGGMSEAQAQKRLDDASTPGELALARTAVKQHRDEFSIWLMAHLHRIFVEQSATRRDTSPHYLAVLRSGALLPKGKKLEWRGSWCADELDEKLDRLGWG